MSVPLVVLRPEPGLTATLIAAFERGLSARGMPLAVVEPRNWRAPSVAFAGILIGSANAVRSAGPELAKVAHLPVLAVGEASAQAAIAAGLEVEQVGEGSLQDLVNNLNSGPRHLLRLAGETHLHLDLPDNITVTTRITYTVHYSAPTKAQAALLREGSLVMLHSGEMARHFSQQCEALEIDKSSLTIAALAPRIAEMAGPGWSSVHIAPSRSDGALLDLAARLCNSLPMGNEGARSGAATMPENGSK
ncbi:MAG: uroporphyrinogen-III synthase [Sphingomonadaceae bacterium]|nr:MAG: uroporphyrinogen-III synthase [Sphingomonadaceae bacterium]